IRDLIKRIFSLQHAKTKTNCKKEVIHMQNAKDYVNQSMSSVQSTMGTLQQALGYAEKQENKNKIQQAINALQSVQQDLSGYQD
ncbi:MAG: hypothetical protein LPK00_14155, partial [Bacillaceae bacterium]|nr:hypothetical protein [Bacillaceae bacterium]